MDTGWTALGPGGACGVGTVETRPEAATAICIETKKQSYTDRQGTKVRVRFTTAEKLNLDTPP